MMMRLLPRLALPLSRIGAHPPRALPLSSSAASSALSLLPAPNEGTTSGPTSVSTSTPPLPSFLRPTSPIWRKFSSSASAAASSANNAVRKTPSHHSPASSPPTPPTGEESFIKSSVNTTTSTTTTTTTASSPPLPSGTFYVLEDTSARDPNRIRRYKIMTEIGAGNYAVVKEAVDKQTGNRVAIKVMDKARCGKAICKNEVDVLLSLNRTVKHQRVTPVLDVFEDAERLYIVLELLRGGELYDRVSKRGRLSEPEVAQILRKLVYALSALHRHGILHRDIKLENIVMQSDEDGEGGNPAEFKLTDFGFAVANQGAPPAVSSAATTTTTPPSNSAASSSTAVTKQQQQQQQTRLTSFRGSLAGTLGYAAPEVLREGRYTPACDVWSAGVVTYILLAGYPPFPLGSDDDAGLSVKEKVARELETIETGRAPEEWKRNLQMEPWNTISPEAKNLVTKMLTLDWEKRITTRGILSHPFVRKHTEAHNSEYTNFE